MPLPYATPAQQAAFVSSVYPYAQTASAQTGLPVDFIIGQSAVESGWGQSNLAQSFNNFFGIGGPGNFQAYNNASASFQAWSNLINNNYDTSALGGSSASQIAGSLASQGYTGDPGYASAVGGATNQIDKILAQLKLSGGTASGTAASGSGSPSSSCGQFDYVCQLQAWINEVSFGAVWVIVGIILLIAALFIFAKQSGLADKAGAALSKIPVPVEA